MARKTAKKKTAPKKSTTAKKDAGRRKPAAKQAAGKKKESSALFTFKRYKKEEGEKTKKGKHPKLIVDQEEKNYGFMGLTSSPKRGNHKNIPLAKNPQKGRKDQAYIRNELRYDDMSHFGETLSDYKLSKADREIIKAILQNKKKK